LTKTLATCRRSSATPVSFSMIEARISASCALSSGRPSARPSHAAARITSCASRIRAITLARVSPARTS
jgi:hypothetical protein